LRTSLIFDQEKPEKGQKTWVGRKHYTNAPKLVRQSGS